MQNWWLLPGTPEKFKETKTQWLFEKINNLPTLVQTHWFCILTSYFSLVGYHVLARIVENRNKIGIFELPSINSQLSRRTGMGQASFASRRSRGILLNHQPSIRSLKKRFPQVTHHHITSLLQLFIGPSVLFFNFVMLLKWWLSITCLAKFGNIQNMKLKNVKHPFIL